LVDELQPRNALQEHAREPDRCAFVVDHGARSVGAACETQDDAAAIVCAVEVDGRTLRRRQQVGLRTQHVLARREHREPPHTRGVRRDLVSIRLARDRDIRAGDRTPARIDDGAGERRAMREGDRDPARLAGGVEHQVLQRWRPAVCGYLERVEELAEAAHLRDPARVRVDRALVVDADVSPDDRRAARARGDRDVDRRAELHPQHDRLARRGDPRVDAIRVHRVLHALTR
jgi:hypothetical protein